MERLKLSPVRMYLAATALRDREEGQAMVEYALILALVSIVAVTVLTSIGTKVSVIFQSINDDL
jgi:pilus assembly protein Flp/PilA